MAPSMLAPRFRNNEFKELFPECSNFGSYVKDPTAPQRSKILPCQFNEFINPSAVRSDSIHFLPVQTQYETIGVTTLRVSVYHFKEISDCISSNTIYVRQISQVRPETLAILWHT